MSWADSAEKLAKSEREGAWREMAKQIAHEIKNPLTPMKLSIQHLQRSWSSEKDNLDEIFDRVTGVLVEQIDSLSTLATEFSAFAKMPESKFQELNIYQILQSIVNLYVETPGVTIEYTVSKEIDKEVLINFDKDRLLRIFNNLIKNSIQAIPEDRDGMIEVALQSDNEKVIVTVTDNGVGISEAEQSKIFLPNFSTKSSGMGLGLAIVRKIIEGTGGSIGFNSEEGKGTIFTVIFPLH